MELRHRSSLEPGTRAHFFSTDRAAELVVVLRATDREGGFPHGSVIAFGCHGGRRRSFALAERFRLPLEAHGPEVSLAHLRLRLI